MPPSIVVFGAGPGLGRAVARRYARAGYTVVLVARRQAPLEELAADLASTGATAHVFTADLSDTDAVPRLAGQIRGAVGDPGALYYGVSAGGFIPVAALTPERAQALMPLAALLAAGPGAGVPAGHARTRRRRHLERARRQRRAGHAAHRRRVRPGRAAQLPAVTARRGGRPRASMSAASTSARRSSTPPSMNGGRRKGPPEPPCRTCPRLTRTISPTFSGPCTARRASRKPPTPPAYPATEHPGDRRLGAGSMPHRRSRRAFSSLRSCRCQLGAGVPEAGHQRE